MSQNNNQDNTLRTLGIVALGVIVFALVYNTLLGGRSGFGFEMSWGMNNGLNLNGALASILILAVRLLWVVFVVSVIAGIVVVAKKYLEDNKIDLNSFTKLYHSGQSCPCCGAKVSAEFKYCPSCQASLKATCSECGKELLNGWKCCPECGKEVTDATK